MRRLVQTALLAAGCAAALAGGAGGAEAKAAAAKGYVGSRTCGTCHAVEYRSWKESLHSRIVQPREQGLLREAADRWATDGVTPGPTTGNVTGKRFALQDVRYVIGSRWKQRYLVADDSTGGLQFLDKEYNRTTGRWEPYGNRNDWAMTCGGCHTTGYRLTKYDPAHPEKARAEWSEPGVACEMCHGPGARHARSRAKKDIWNFVGKTPFEQSRVCGYCHVRLENRRFLTPQGNGREDLPAPTVGDTYRPWDDWTKWYPEQVVLPGVHPSERFDGAYGGEMQGMFRVDAFAKQNGIYEEARHHQQYQGFIQSAHYASGKVSCITCHAPHAGRGRLRRVPQDSCGVCHDDDRSPDTHMPNTGVESDNLYVRTHTFARHPRPSSAPNGTAAGVPEHYR